VQADSHDPFPSCDVCGRTILKGEQIHEYLTQQRQRITVCALCRSRAEASGWIPAAEAHAIAEDQPSRSRGQALRRRLSRVTSRTRSRDTAAEESQATRSEVDSGEDQVAAVEGARTEPAEPTVPDPKPVAESGKEEPPKRAPKPRAKRPARSRTPKPKPKEETSGQPARPKSQAKRGPEALMRRAVEHFNSSEERRKVAGLTKSLGAPHAGVRPDPSRQLAMVTIAWELSWYQWEVSADGDTDDEPVREIAKGDEVSELAEEARTWNAAVGEDGTLRLRSTTERRKPSAPED
jgi:hypothetical protein